MSIRHQIIEETSKLVSSNDIWTEVDGAPEPTISNDIGRPSFEESDLPVIHVYMANEDVDEFLLDNIYEDIRTSPLLIDIYLNKHVPPTTDVMPDPVLIPFIEQTEKDLRNAVRYMERIMRAVNTDIQAFHQKSEPGRPTIMRDVIQLVLSQFTFSIEKESDPKVGRIHIEYQAKYHVRLQMK